MYFFNPFRESLFRGVLHRIVLEAAGKPHDTIYIVYIHPSFPEVFGEFPELRLLARVRFLMPLYGPLNALFNLTLVGLEMQRNQGQ